MKRYMRCLTCLLSLFVILPFALERLCAQTTYQMAEDYMAGKIPYKARGKIRALRLRFGSHPSGPRHAIAQTAEFSHKQLEKESNGKLIIKGFYSNVLTILRAG